MHFVLWCLPFHRPCDRPRVIESLRGSEVVDIDAGSAHSACILANGDLMTWGKGRYGRLGHGNSDDVMVPRKVAGLGRERCVDVACGGGDAQTICVTVSADGKRKVWSWGDSDYGKLGRPSNNGTSQHPGLVEDLSDKDIVSVKCGSQFSLVLSSDGSVYSW